jgi:hypothetical protein
MEHHMKVNSCWKLNYKYSISSTMHKEIAVECTRIVEACRWCLHLIVSSLLALVAGVVGVHLVAAIIQIAFRARTLVARIAS